MKKRETAPKNAFERAQEAALAFQISWWQSIEEAIANNDIKAEISEPQFIRLGDEQSALGPRLFERRSLTIRLKGKRKKENWTITRPLPVCFSALPLEMLEELARELLTQCEAEWRQANIDNLVAHARSYDRKEALSLARDLLGADADTEELEHFADQMRFPAELIEGGDAAAQFFDEAVSCEPFDVAEDGTVEFLPESPPAPGAQPFDVGEWDYYTPEEVADFDGPETDAAYAFRVVRLCEAIRSNPDGALQLAMQLGAVTREWEIWRENEEFLVMGRARFAEQSRLARSKREKPWMTRVRADFAAGEIGPNIAGYARKLARRRNLQPPSVDRIRNFVSLLKRERLNFNTDDTSQ